MRNPRSDNTPTIAVCLASIALVAGGCRSASIDGAPGTPAAREPVPAAVVGWERFESAGGQLSVRYPAEWQATEERRGEPTHRIGLRPTNLPSGVAPPLLVHADAAATFVSVFPQGFGTELPAGQLRSLSRAPSETPPVTFELDRTASYALLLADGSAWGYLLRPDAAPPGWTTEAFVFAQIGVEDYRAECFAPDGRPVAPEQCDPLAGDELVRHGTVRTDRAEQVRGILASIRLGPASVGTATGTGIEVESPVEHATVSPPLQITGRARGPWFFEGSFSVRLVAGNGDELASTRAEAEAGWMTDAFVPFTARLDFDPAAAGSATLVLEGANPSGLPENARVLRVPIRLGR